MDYAFTATIKKVLEARYGAHGSAVFEASPLLGYINIKTRSATRGSAARGVRQLNRPLP